MSQIKLLLCTDMDRTVIPNGAQPEHPFARERFSAFCRQPQVTLVYVTGRHKALVEEAIKEYSLPEPDYAITDVGTKIYGIHNQQWQESAEWEKEIDKEWNGKSREQLEALFEDITDLHLQEAAKQNTHKLSYYVDLQSRKESLISLMKERLEIHRVQASLVWSVDEPKNIGLLDVLPRNATKVHAIEFLRLKLGYLMTELIFAGDSGNDLPVLGSPVPSVLVANASMEVKEAARNLAQSKGNLQSFYLATGKNSDMDGNYSAGILEGICHFLPGLRRQLKGSGFNYD